MVMMRPIRGETLVIASHNKGKVQEIADLLADYDVRAVSAATLGLPEPDETGATFEANALLKAQAAATTSGMLSLADDSGLVVPAINNQPGIYSARWAGPERDFIFAMHKVHATLKVTSVPPEEWRAHFICVLALAWPDGETRHFEGRVDGRLVFPPRGSQGFGYDPIFVPDGDTRSFGEMDPAEKHAISHRAAAFKRLLAACESTEAAA